MKFLTLSLLLLFTACVTPKPENMKRDVAHYTLPKLPKNGGAILYVVRPATLGAMIKFNIFIDNKEADSEVGYTKGKEYLYIYLSAGQHQILSKAKNWALLNIDVKEGDILFLEQKPSSGFPLPSNELIRLLDYEGKYHVKHLKLGTFIKEAK